MGTSCSLPRRKSVSFPSKVIKVQSKDSLGVASTNPQKGKKDNTFSLTKINVNPTDEKQHINHPDEEIKADPTYTHSSLKYGQQELGIGEYYLKKELKNQKKENLKSAQNLQLKEAKSHAKWDRAIVKMRVLFGSNSHGDTLYNHIDWCLKEYALYRPQKYMRMLKYGPPMRYRWTMWKNSVDLDKFYVRSLYEKFKRLSSPWETTIKKDIHRSFPDEPFFSAKFEQIGQEQLYNVLKALSLYFPNIGYTQSMNFLVGFMLLINGGNELEAFWMFVTLARDHRFLIMGLFEKDLPLLDFYIYIFYEILHKEIPEVYSYLKQQQIPDQMWLLKWFMTLFLYSFPPKYVIKFWDFIFQEGLIGMIKIALGIINFIQKDLVKLDICGLDQLFRHLTEKSTNNGFPDGNKSIHEQNEGLDPATMARFNSHIQSSRQYANSQDAQENDIEKENPANAISFHQEYSELDFSFQELDIYQVLNYAKKVDLSLQKINGVIKLYMDQLEKDIPRHYIDLLQNWEEYIQDPKKLEKWQKDIEYHIMKSELVEPITGSDELFVHDLVDNEESFVLKESIL